MKAKLIVVGGTTKSTQVELRLPTVIGRGKEAAITIPHSLISRQHCEIVEANGKLLVRDLGSLNGTYIGKERITEAVLEPGGLLTVGTVTFRAVYEIEDMAVAARPAEPSVTDSVDGSLDETAGHSSAILSVPNPVPSDEPLDDETAKFESEIPLSQLLPGRNSDSTVSANLPVAGSEAESKDESEQPADDNYQAFQDFLKKLR